MNEVFSRHLKKRDVAEMMEGAEVKGALVKPQLLFENLN